MVSEWKATKSCVKSEWMVKINKKGMIMLMMESEMVPRVDTSWEELHEGKKSFQIYDLLSVFDKRVDFGEN